jgi:hypothetical protein
MAMADAVVAQNGVSVKRKRYAVGVDRSLLDQIAAGGADEESTLLRVYADQLIERGDSFGELIVVASERLVKDSPELRRREDALIHEHGVRILGDERWGRDELRWRRGFIDAIELDSEGTGGIEMLARLADEPAARLVRRLTVRPKRDDGIWDTGALIAALARLARRFPRLVELAVNDGELAGWFDEPVQPCDAAVLVAAFPRLERFELRGRDLQLGDLELPAVRGFAASWLAPEDVRRIVAARMPVLEELELAFRYGSGRDLAATFGPLLHRDFGPQLTGLSLAMPTVEAQRWLIAELPPCPLARHVKRLAFRRAELDDAMLARLIADAEGWRTLERLELPERGISASRMARLSRTFGRTLALV